MVTIILIFTKILVNYTFNTETKIISPLVNEKSIIIYTLQNCIYCTKAIDLLQQKRLKYKQISLDENQETRLSLIHQTGQKSIPYVFIDNNFIGGFQDLQNLNYTDKL